MLSYFEFNVRIEFINHSVCQFRTSMSQSLNQYRKAVELETG